MRGGRGRGRGRREREYIANCEFSTVHMSMYTVHVPVSMLTAVDISLIQSHSQITHTVHFVFSYSDESSH